MTRVNFDPELGEHRFYFLSCIIILIIRYMPTGQASSAKELSAPLAIAPRENPKTAIAAKRSSGAAQQIAMPIGPLTQLFPCIGQAADPCSGLTAGAVDFPQSPFAPPQRFDQT
ncbi:MAG TPA: hypothetical protein VF089_09980 [Candidatus Binatia bacterium]